VLFIGQISSEAEVFPRRCVLARKKIRKFSRGNSVQKQEKRKVSQEKTVQVLEAEKLLPAECQLKAKSFTRVILSLSMNEKVYKRRLPFKIT
jgi:hypothetical protein